MENLLLGIAYLPFMYLGLFVFAWIWWKCCSWFFILLVKFGEKYFKKDTLPYNIFMLTFVGGGGLASIYLFIWLAVWIAKENGY